MPRLFIDGNSRNRKQLERAGLVRKKIGGTSLEEQKIQRRISENMTLRRHYFINSSSTLPRAHLSARN